MKCRLVACVVVFCFCIGSNINAQVNKTNFKNFKNYDTLFYIKNNQIDFTVASTFIPKATVTTTIGNLKLTPLNSAGFKVGVSYTRYFHKFFGIKLNSLWCMLPYSYKYNIPSTLFKSSQGNNFIDYENLYEISNWEFSLTPTFRCYLKKGVYINIATGISIQLFSSGTTTTNYKYGYFDTTQFYNNAFHLEIEVNPKRSVYFGLPLELSFTKQFIDLPHALTFGLFSTITFSSPAIGNYSFLEDNSSVATFGKFIINNQYVGLKVAYSFFYNRKSKPATNQKLE